jgi:hypothetical protein
MPSNGAAANVRPAIGAAVNRLRADCAEADNRGVIVAIAVSAQGLDLSQPA